MRKLNKKTRTTAIVTASVLVLGGLGIGIASAYAADEPTPSATASPDSTDESKHSRGSRGTREVIDPATVTVTEDAAKATALAAVGSGTVEDATLRAPRTPRSSDTTDTNIEANPVWHIHIVDGETRTSVDIDAMTGEVVSTRERAAGTNDNGGSRRRGRRGNGPDCMCSTTSTDTASN